MSTSSRTTKIRFVSKSWVTDPVPVGVRLPSVEVQVSSDEANMKGKVWVGPGGKPKNGETSLKGEPGCLFGSLILWRHLQTDKTGTGSWRRPAVGVCGGVSYPSPSQLVTAGGAQDGQSLQMIQHLWSLAVFMCPPNLRSLPPPPSLLLSLRPRPPPPSSVSNTLDNPLLPSSTLNKSSLREVFSCPYMKLCNLTVNNSEWVGCPICI